MEPEANGGPGEVVKKKRGANLKPVPDGCYRDEKGIIRKIVPASAPDGTPGPTFDRLASMRRVLNGQATSEPEKAMKALMKRNPDKFFDTLDRLEQEEKALNSAKGGSAAGAGDGGDRPPRDELNTRLKQESEFLWELWAQRKSSWPPPPSRQGKPAKP